MNGWRARTVAGVMRIRRRGDDVHFRKGIRGEMKVAGRSRRGARAAVAVRGWETGQVEADRCRP